MVYKIGTRIKKLRSKFGINIGNTGIVVAGPSDYLPQRCDMFVRQDQALVDAFHQAFPPGTVSVCDSSEWEPIIPDGAQPCEEGWSLDTLLNKEQENVETV